MQFDPYTLLGIVGSCCFIAAYFANLQGWLPSSGRGFPAANLAGSVLVLISLFDAWNLPSVILEAFWVAISVYGILRSRRA